MPRSVTRGRLLGAGLLLIASAAIVIEVPSAREPASALGDPVIAAAGDIACDPKSSAFEGGDGTPEDCRQKHTATLLEGADAVLPLGDLQTAVLDRAEDLLDLDLDALGAGRSPGLVPTDDVLFCVCTHGKHDACCAERGRPVAEALSKARPEQTWEVSHIGGDRFSANALVLPYGLYLGRLTPDSALAAAADVLAGRLPLEVLRGRSCLPMPAQAAEIALRGHLGETAMAAVRVERVRRDGETTTVDLEAAGRRWAVLVRTMLGEDVQLTCRALRRNPRPHHEVVEMHER